MDESYYALLNRAYPHEIARACVSTGRFACRTRAAIALVAAAFDLAFTTPRALCLC